MFCVDSQRSETRVPREVTRSKMAEDAESKIAVRLVNEYGYKESSTGTLFAKKKIETDRHYWIVSKQCSEVDSCEYELKL